MQLTASKVYEEYLRRTPTSRKLAEQARELFPSGVTHDARYVQPYPIYVERAAGSRKWDVDGNEYVDYPGGHGSMLLGHAHPAVTEAVQKQMPHGTHYGSSHALEIQWAQLVQKLMPSSERVRFTGTGTEATMLAFRLVRAFTGKPKILRFITNFHGWHDHVSFGVGSHHDGTPTPGVLNEIAENTILCPPGDIEAVRKTLQEHDDIAAVILEPTGATWGQIPNPPSFLHDLREVTAEHDTVLIFDEVVTGFRCSPGGAQGHFGITPDMTTLAKVLAGGLPGGAVTGRRDILELLDHQASAEAGREKIAHQGTFNANPASAAAGIAALTLVAETDVCQRANDYAARLREALQKVIVDENLKWCVYGSFSGFHIYTNPDGDSITSAEIEAGLLDYRKIKVASAQPSNAKLRLAMLTHGVDTFPWPGGPTSCVHSDDDLQQTADAFQKSIRILKEEDDI